MSVDIVAGLVSAFILGVTVGLVLAWVVIPGIVDVWAGSHRKTVVYSQRRNRRRGR